MENNAVMDQMLSVYSTAIMFMQQHVSSCLILTYCSKTRGKIWPKSITGFQFVSPLDLHTRRQFRSASILDDDKGTQQLYVQHKVVSV